MSIFLREFEGYNPEDASKYSQTPLTESESHKKDLKEWFGDNPTSFMPVIHALHCYPYATGNFTRYMSEGCRSSLKLWTEPYQRPTIMYHNDYDGVINGRIQEASMEVSKETNTDVLVLKASAPGWQTRDDLSNGILKTVSVGVSGTDVRCSICGQQLAEGERCEHQRGAVYDGETCYWDVYEFTPKELSYVIVPSDKYAQVVSIHQTESVNSGDNDISLRAAEGLKNNKTNIKLIESQNLEGKNKMDENKEMQIKESLATIEALKSEKNVWSKEKISLTEQITSLNNEKVQLHESIENMKKESEAKDVEIKQGKELIEAAEKKVADLNKEVKTNLVDILNNMRESAGKAKLEKLEERSIDSLRDSIADLKEELKTVDLKDSKGKVNDPTLTESQKKLDTKPDDTKNVVKDEELTL